MKATTVSAGSYGSTTAIPTFTVDIDGRITAAGSTDVSTVLAISGSTGGNDSVSLLSDALTFTGNGGLTANVANNQVTIGTNGSGLVSGSSFTSSTQGRFSAATNSNSTVVDLGLQVSDTPTFSGITINNHAVINGNLDVNGDLTYINTTNLAITDKFILLNSGSANPDEGGIIIDEGSGIGHGLVFDNSDLRFGVNKSIDSKANNTSVNESYVALVVDENNSAHDITDTEYHKRGNIKVDSSDDIYIWA